MTESTQDQILELLNSLGTAPTYADVQRLGGKLLRLCRSTTAYAPGKHVRVMLASSFTIDPLAPALAVECCRAGLHPVIEVDGFNTFGPHFLDPSSSLYEFAPDIVFLAAELGAITPLLSGADSYPAEIAQDAINRLKNLIDTFKRKSQALLIVFNFAAPVQFPFSLNADHKRLIYHRVNTWLEETFANDSQVYVLNFECLCSFHGKCRTRDPKLHYLGSIELSESFLPVVAKACGAFVQASKGLSRKCLVLDLDNTLWGGVLGEDGQDGIHLARNGAGSEYYDFQKCILDLYKRGVILAVNSKNNLPEVQKVLHEHPEMLLREQHFASFKINWDDKVTNLKNIAKELNLGLDSLVFVDDNPAERAWVRQSLPEVMVIELASDPALYAQAIEQLTAFEVLMLTEEDRKRGEQYASERARRQSCQEGQDLEAFLKSLSIVLTIRLAEPQDFPRIGQLTRKTNQFNMTGRRYSDIEIAQLAQSSNMLVYTLRVRDTFGDSGLVGVTMLRSAADCWNIDTFLMSCRVLGRKIEYAFLTEVLSDARERGIRRVEAEFLPTPKNAPAVDFYQNFGFEKMSEDAGRLLWRLEIKNWTPASAEWCTVEWENRELEVRVR